MFQSVGVEIVPLIAEAIGVPIVLKEIKGKSKSVQLTYEEITEGDEVEDLFELLSLVKAQFPEVQAVASGAIFSNY